ncbi:MAG: AMP-binding protein [Deltaproteobacteria bacterium]|nr:AMP-binding protein [Deltaproteobacteria bacterium]MBK8713380.1 AMP-binding protein [Deltaproteobacteria bacterium]MBP7291149.1 AMP-binding protein [Nannocystaceae bacterium]
MSWVHPDARVAGLDGDSRWSQLLRDADALTVSPAIDTVVLACASRRAFVIGAALAWSRQLRLRLPANLRPATIAALAGPHAVVLDDAALAPVRDDAALASDDGHLAQLARIATPAVELYTSGSTTAPLAVPKTGDELLAEAHALTLQLGLGPASRITCTPPPHHIYGLLFGVIAPALAGASVAEAMPLQPEAIVATLARHGSDVLVTTPAQLRACSVLARGAFAGLARVVSSGAPLGTACATMVREHLGIAVTEVLGSSETGGIASRVHDRDDPPWVPLPGVHVRADDDGRMHVQSPWCGHGLPIATADRIAMSEHGFVHLGRVDDVLKIAGIRVALTEVTAHALALSGVTDAHALRLPAHDGRGDAIGLLVATTTLDPASVRAALAERFDAVALPRRVVCTEALPRNDRGKLERNVALAALGVTAVLEPLVVSRDEQHTRVRFEIDGALPYFDGHFPGDPVLPGVVVLEQLVARTVARTWPGLGGMRRARRVKFTRTIRPGDAVEVELRRRGAQVDFRVSCGDEACASGTVIFAAAAGAAVE